MKKHLLLFCALVSGMGIFAQAPKRVVVEDFTGTWCGYCPRGKTTIEQCVAAYPTTIGMEVHNGDTYANTYSNAIITGINPPGFPMGAVDRFAFSGSTSAFDTPTWKTKVATRLSTASPVAIGIASTYNTSTRALSVTVTANFVGAASGDLRISCILTEDGVVTSSDPQHNYMGTGCGSTDPSSPWYTFPCSMPTYTHNGVARVNLAADSWGTSALIPSTVTAGSSYNKTYTYTLPSTMNANNMYIVALVGKYGTASTAREILNANKVQMGSSTTGIIENTRVDQIQVKQNAPNPFSDITAMQFTLNTSDNVSVKVYNSFGQLVNTIFDARLIPGEHTFYWAGTDSDGKAVAGGVYYYTISTSKQQVTKPVVFIAQ